MVVHLCNGKLHFAPLHNPRTILDVGTGTGIWAIDVADEYPEADVLGIDLSPIQPSWVPANARFMVDDAEMEWVQPPDSLDYVHLRFMCSSIRNWPLLLQRAYRALKPGGWIELQELRYVVSCDDGSLADDNAFARFLVHVRKGLGRLGVELLTMDENPRLLREAGFAAVDERVFKAPIGVWPRDPHLKQVGLYSRSVIHDGLHGVGIGPLTRGLGWSANEVELYLVDVRKGLFEPTAHMYFPYHIALGQKPLS